MSAAIITTALLGTALLPSEASIGAAAPVLLLCFRLAMGFSVGAEYSGIVVYLVESAPTRRRGFVARRASGFATIGTLLAAGVAALLAATLSQGQLDRWGWRLAFLLGALLALIVFILRRVLEETPAFRRARETGRIARNPLRHVLTANRRALAVAFVVSGGAATAYWLCISYLPTYLDSTVGLSHAEALLWPAVATVAFVVVTPWAGLLSDVVGRKPVLVAIVGLVVLTAYPLFALLSVGTQVAVALGAVALAVQVAIWEAVVASAVPEQFATVERLSAMAFGYNLAVAIFGGLAPLVATLLVKLTDNDLAPSFLLTGAAMAASSVLFLLRETAGRDLRTS